MELKDTIGMMISDDYKERFKAEYYQTKIRYKELLSMILDAMDDSKLNPNPPRCVDVLERQLKYMDYYLDVLITRAQIEGIEL